MRLTSRYILIHSSLQKHGTIQTGKHLTLTGAAVSAIVAPSGQFTGVYIMSNVSNRHAVTPFVAGTSKPFTGQRLARAGFKLTEKMKAAGKVALPSVCASVPFINGGDIHQYLTELLPHVGAMLEKAQDEILRSRYESAGGVLSDITDEEISIPACIAFLNAETAGSRLSTETIGAWFDTALTDSLTVLIADKLGFDLSTSEQESTVAKHIKNHRDVLGMLAGKNVILAPRQISAITNMLELAEEDTMHSKLSAKLAALTNKKEEEFLI